MSNVPSAKKTKKAKRWILFLLPLVLLFGAWQAPALFLFGIKWKIGTFCKQRYNASFNCSELSWKQGRVRIEKAMIVSPHFTLSIPETTVDLTLDWTKRNLNSDIHIRSPVLTCQSEILKKPFQAQSIPIPFLSHTLEIALSDGQIIYEGHQDIGCSALFNKGKEAWKGELIIEDQTGHPCLTLEGSGTHEKKSFLQCNFKDKGFIHLYMLARYAGLLQKPAFQWNYQKGCMNGSLEAEFDKNQLDLFRGALQGYDLTIGNAGLNLRVEAKSIDFVFSTTSGKDKLFEAWNGSFLMEEGAFSLFEPSQGIWKEMGPLELCKSELVIKEGQIESSSIQAKWLGMEGSLSLDWRSSHELLRIKLAGESPHMFPFLPTSLKGGFAEAFPNDTVAVDAWVKRRTKGIELEGNVAISDASGKDHVLSFGCKFGEDLAKDSKIIDRLHQQGVQEGGVWDRIMNQFYLSHHRVGWFRGNDLPVEKFLSSFLFQGVSLTASGIVNIEATFDNRFLIVLYDGGTIQLNHPQFCLRADIKKDGEDKLGVHCIDFKTFDQLGLLPIENTMYFQNHLKAPFSNGTALVHFENHKIHLKQIRCNWKEVAFEGEMDFDFHRLDDIDMTIATHAVEGPIRHARELFSCFIPSFAWKIPLDGTVKSKEKGVFLKFNFHPKAKLIDANLAGLLETSYQTSLANLHNYETQFCYDLSSNQLIFTEGKGELRLTKELETGYHVSIPELSFGNLSAPQITFEAQLTRPDGKIITYKGASEGTAEQRSFKVEGDAFFLKGNQTLNQVQIESFSLGNLKGSTAIEIDEKGCHFTQLRLKQGNFCSFASEGSVEWQTGLLKGELSHLIVDLNALSDFPQIQTKAQKWLSVWKPHGKLSGQGEVVWSLSENLLQIQTVSDFHGLEFGGMRFGDGENLRCHFSSSEGFVVEGLEGTIPSATSVTSYKLGKFHYHPDEQKIEFDAFDFSLPPSRLPWIASCASQLFPGKIQPSLRECVVSIKQEEPLEGRVSVTVYPNQVNVTLNLKDGCYFLWGQPCTLRKFSLTFDSLEFQIETACSIKGENYWVTLSADSQTLDQGMLFIRDQPGQKEALIAYWKKDEKGTFQIDKVTGQACGIGASLERKESSEVFHYEGKVELDLARLFHLLSPELQQVIAQIALGKGYCFAGDFYIPKDFNFSKVVFEGGLFGNAFEVGGLEISALSSHVFYEAGKILVQDLCVHDPAGQLFIDTISCFKKEEKWHFDIPTLRLSNMRIGRLKTEKFEQQRKAKFFRSFLIPRLEVESLSGIIGEKMSVLGKGEMQFSNLPPKNLLSNLLLIPTEITARIGLDLSLLVPVRGTIIYEIHDGRIYLLKLHHMYSEGKRSRFYLAKGAPAYLDFDGNLNFKVKMKQYNLLMKLAEFFTVTVRGSLLKPTYTLMNQFEEGENGDEI